jgi:hypothetical protein
VLQLFVALPLAARADGVALGKSYFLPAAEMGPRGRAMARCSTRADLDEGTVPIMSPRGRKGGGQPRRSEDCSESVRGTKFPIAKSIGRREKIATPSCSNLRWNSKMRGAALCPEAALTWERRLIARKVQ